MEREHAAEPEQVLEIADFQVAGALQGVMA